MKIILTGATGTAGSEVLRQALVDRDVSEVLVLSRRPLDVADPKLTIVLLDNFLDYTAIAPRLAGYDACLWCLGVSQTEVSKPEYEKITHDYALAAARAMANTAETFRFCFLSGRDADSAEKSSILFARIKGKTENALTRLSRPKAWHLSPGLHPSGHGAAEAADRAMDRAVDAVVLQFLPAHIISTVELAKAMLAVAMHGSSKTILENDDIRDISRT